MNPEFVLIYDKTNNNIDFNELNGIKYSLIGTISDHSLHPPIVQDNDNNKYKALSLMLGDRNLVSIDAGHVISINPFTMVKSAENVSEKTLKEAEEKAREVNKIISGSSFSSEKTADSIIEEAYIRIIRYFLISLIDREFDNKHDIRSMSPTKIMLNADINNRDRILRKLHPVAERLRKVKKYYKFITDMNNLTSTTGPNYANTYGVFNNGKFESKVYDIAEGGNKMRIHTIISKIDAFSSLSKAIEVKDVEELLDALIEDMEKSITTHELYKDYKDDILKEAQKDGIVKEIVLTSEDTENNYDLAININDTLSETEINKMKDKSKIDCYHFYLNKIKIAAILSNGGQVITKRYSKLRASIDKCKNVSELKDAIHSFMMGENNKYLRNLVVPKAISQLSTKIF